MKYRVTVRWMSREDYIVTADSSAEALANWSDGTLTNSVEEGPTAVAYRLPEDADRGGRGVSADLRALAREVVWADGCYGTVTRGGEMYACEKPAVAMVRGEFDGDELYWLGDEFYWPACAWHVNRFGPGVPLSEVVAALRQADRGAEA